MEIITFEGEPYVSPVDLAVARDVHVRTVWRALKPNAEGVSQLHGVMVSGRWLIPLKNAEEWQAKKRGDCLLPDGETGPEQVS